MKFNLHFKLGITCIFFIAILALVSCKNAKENNVENTTENQEAGPFFKLSLAQWSLHRAIKDDKTLDPVDFAQKANELGFSGLEYVSQLYNGYLNDVEDAEGAMQRLLDTLKVKSEKYNMENLIIMVDGEGDLAAPVEEERDSAVEKHKKWVDAAQFLGCHSIRVNTFGTNNPVLWRNAAEDGLRKLSIYAASKNINVLVENHGWLSSDAPKVVEVMEAVGMENCGTLPDFGNWCIKRQAGERWGACLEEYPDMYEGIHLLMPFAKAVSAKSYDFDESGNETKIDYSKMLKIVKEAGYKGYIGVEYEGTRLGEEAGIKATRDLLLKVAKELN